MAVIPCSAAILSFGTFSDVIQGKQLPYSEERSWSLVDIHPVIRICQVGIAIRGGVRCAQQARMKKFLMLKCG